LRKVGLALGRSTRRHAFGKLDDEHGAGDRPHVLNVELADTYKLSSPASSR